MGQPAKEELFELIIDSAEGIAIFTIDPSGMVTSWNVGAERLFGWPEAEILSLPGDLIFTAEDRSSQVPERERLQATEQGRAQDERWHQRKNGSRFWASGLLMPLKNPEFGFVKIARDLTQQHLAQELLRENEERFRLLATSIPQLVFVTRPDGNRTWGSPQWISFTGLSLDQSVGFGWLDAVHRDDLDATQAGWSKAQETGEYSVVHRVRRAADGEYRWHQTRAKPVDLKSEGSDWIGTMTDVHDLHEMQSRQQVLMQELQHRTRNLLSVVQSIATRTIRASQSLDAFRTEFESRLGALSRVQSLLARVDDHQIDLPKLVAAELAAHSDDGLASDKIHVEGPSINLPAAAAQAIGLALHELATNAVKYGALSKQEGKLTVRWDVKDEGPNTRVSLTWIESGVPLPIETISKRRGYGTELIERALPYQLQARTKLTFASDGVHCEIEVPVSA
jgi:PAS domain S-box-containing protein